MDVEKSEPSDIAGGDVKRCSHFGKTVWQFLKELNIGLPHVSIMLLLAIYP